jgi:hypothetical protein
VTPYSRRGMTDIKHHATNVIENATVHIDSIDQHTVDAEYVEYCVSSGYVKAVDSDERSHITHITNVEICAEEDAEQTY